MAKNNFFFDKIFKFFRSSKNPQSPNEPSKSSQESTEYEFTESKSTKKSTKSKKPNISYPVGRPTNGKDQKILESPSAQARRSSQSQKTHSVKHGQDPSSYGAVIANSIKTIKKRNMSSQSLRLVDLKNPGNDKQQFDDLSSVFNQKEPSIRSNIEGKSRTKKSVSNQSFSRNSNSTPPVSTRRKKKSSTSKRLSSYDNNSIIEPVAGSSCQLFSSSASMRSFDSFRSCNSMSSTVSVPYKSKYISIPKSNGHGKYVRESSIPIIHETEKDSNSGSNDEIDHGLEADKSSDPLAEIYSLPAPSSRLSTYNTPKSPSSPGRLNRMSSPTVGSFHRNSHSSTPSIKENSPLEQSFNPYDNSTSLEKPRYNYDVSSIKTQDNAKEFGSVQFPSNGLQVVI